MRVPRIWSRFAVMTYNVLTALKRLALPEKWLTARPKRMRVQILCSLGKLVSHARRTWLRVRRLRDQLAEWISGSRHPACRSRCEHSRSYGRIVEPILRTRWVEVCAKEAARRLAIVVDLRSTRARPNSFVESPPNLQIANRLHHGAGFLPAYGRITDRSSRSRMNFTRIE